MAMKHSTASKSTHEVLPAGSYQGVCYSIVDMGTQYSEKFNSRSRKIKLGFEIPSEMREFKKENGMQPMALYTEYTLSFADKANLKRDLLSWTGCGFDPADKEFDLETLIGKNCLLSVTIFKTAKGVEYNNINGISGLIKGMETLPLINKPQLYNIDDGRNEVFDTFPQFLQEKILKSQEFLPGGDYSDGPTAKKTDDSELPF